MPKQLLVTVTLQERVLQQYSFQQETVKIGRHRACDVVIDNPAISRVHAEIVADGDTFTLLDKGSSNGTQVNGAKASTTPAKNGDVITIGKFRLFVAVPTDAVKPGDALSGRIVTIHSPKESPR